VLECESVKICKRNVKCKRIRSSGKVLRGVPRPVWRDGFSTQL